MRGRMLRLQFPVLVVAIICTLPAGSACPAGELTMHHVGEYAAVPWAAPGEIVIPGSRADRVKGLNLSVASINLSDDMSDAFLAQWASYARWSRVQRKVFLPRVYFWDGNDRFEGSLRDFEVYWLRMDRFLAAMPLEDFHGIVLAEENVAGGGRAEVLEKLYRRIKEKYRIQVFQWWSPSGNVPSWNIPADGWIIDEYFLGGQRFRRIVQRYLVTGAPLVVMPYAAWSAGEEHWSPATWQSLEDQLEVCREYNLPTAFYWVFNTGCHFGLNHGTFMDRINQRVLDWTQEAGKLPADYAGLPSADHSIGDGLEIAPHEEGRLLYRDAFDSSQFIEDADIAGFRSLLWGSDGTLALRSRKEQQPRASLTWRFAGDFPAEAIEASVRVPFLSPGSRATLSLSADGGETWPHVVQSNGTAPQTLSVSAADDPPFHNCRAFRVRVTMSGDPQDGEVVLRIDDLHVAARLSIPAEPEIRLKPRGDGSGPFSYHDDFQTQKFRYSAKVERVDQLEWSRGAISVRMRPGGAQPELIWAVTSPHPLRQITVNVNGRANRGSLGTEHYLDLSTDGRNWSHSASTVGLPVNKSGWAAHGLQAKTGDDPEFAGVEKFYVRLRMHAEAYREVHPYQSGIVEELRIEAEPQTPGRGG
ncbi:MAG: hypothetical protein KDA79_21705 [Planctomycetaceae bacterium]|nr:hypothetical protein [Planctomycetaceae bacterium]